MRKRLALLCFRVARWLAPDYFANRLQSLHEIRMRIGVLRERYCAMPAKQREGREGRFVVAELHSLESVYKSAAAHYGTRYELVKVEVQIAETRELSKTKLFQGMAAALAQSAEIEKFMYFREYGEVRVAGIHLYLKHEDTKRNVGNYDK